MEAYLEYLGNSFTSLTGDQFKLLYFLVMTMASEEADALEISLGYLMDVMGKSERSTKRLINELVNKGFITVDDWCLFRLSLNIDEEEGVQDADNQEETPKRIGYV